MLKIKKLSIKNFMSVGDHEESINFENKNLTLILGSNLDTGPDASSSRNGVGKSTIGAALSFALFGQALSTIAKDNLVNNINKKGMLVTVEFDKDGHSYRIERGRKPNILKFEIDDRELVSDDGEEVQDNNEAQGENKLTQVEIEKILGFSHNLFKNIIALNTKTSPFLDLNAKQQRDFIEELMGLLQLSLKAESLKDLLKETKDSIKEEEFKIKVIQDSNESIQKSITDLERRSSLWNKSHDSKITELQEAISSLSEIDINQELLNHTSLVLYNEKKKTIDSINNEMAIRNNSKANCERRVIKLQSEAEKVKEATCPTCSHTLLDEQYAEILKNLEDELDKELLHYEEIVGEYDRLLVRLEECGSLGVKPDVFYSDANTAHEHRNNINSLSGELKILQTNEDPYIEQIETLKNKSLQDVSYDTVNNLVKLRDHQEFLLKLLTNKDSFIRKKILDQNLNYLNVRLTYYLEKLGLPHKVLFLSDMTVEIRHNSSLHDFSQLSRGESTRLILALSFSFRDMFELLNYPVNLLINDEFFDSGLDSSGVEMGYNVLRDKSRNEGKNVWLISHREELIPKVSSILKVIKENGFTRFVPEESF